VPDDGPDIRLGAFPGVLADLAPESAALVVADPPWGEESAWSDLAEFAVRVLRPNGVVLAYLGTRAAFRAIDLLAARLTPVRLAFLPGPGWRPWDRSVRCHVAGSFMAVMAKGEFDPPGESWTNMVERVEGEQDDDRRQHQYQRPLSNVEHYVEAFTRPGDLVVDPFLGSGTTAVACARLGRRIVGCDVDAACIATTRSRLAEVAPAPPDGAGTAGTAAAG
jgi:site-specific DNA-methyltransferase (adenine-specific)